MRSALRRLAWASQPATIGAVLWLTLGGLRGDLGLPALFSGDRLAYLAEAKATIDHGWWWTNPSIGAPALHHALILPQSTNVDQALVRGVSLFRHEVMSAVTASWFVMILLCGASAAWCLRRLGVSAAGAWTTGALFALGPSVIFRDIAYFNLTQYLIPFAATIALKLAAEPDIEWRAMRGLLMGNVLLGVAALGDAVAGAFFVALGAVAGSVIARRPARLIAGAAALAAILVPAALNQGAVLIARHEYGQPQKIVHHEAESESYTLKVRHLITPLPGHWFPPFRAWAERDSHGDFPNEEGKTGSHLGLIATIGFLGLIAVVMVPSLAGRHEGAETVRAASRLTLAAIALATFGGLGTLISLLVSAEIHSYSRVIPFIAFFSLAAVALWIDRATAGRRSRRALVWASVLIVGVLDQTLVGVRPLGANAPALTAEFGELRRFLSFVEVHVPPQAMIFQLPVRPYPAAAGIAHMGPYDHFKPYLASQRLRWSYPALSIPQIRRAQVAAEMDPRVLPAHLAQRGFAAILVDRAGYKDNGAAVVAALKSEPNQAMVISQTNRYVVFHLNLAAASPR